MAKREKPAANRKPASRSMPVAPPPAVEECDFSDLEDDMVVVRCPPIDRGEPDDDFDDLLEGLALPDFDLLEDLKPAELNPCKQATELAGLFTLRVLLRMPRLAALWSNENGKSHGYPLLRPWLADDWPQRLRRRAAKRGQTSLWLDDDDMPSNADWNALLTTSAGQAVLHEALARADLASPLSWPLPAVLAELQSRLCLSQHDMQLLCYLATVYFQDDFKSLLELVHRGHFRHARPAQFLACALNVKIMDADSWLQDERQLLARCGLMVQTDLEYAPDLAEMLELSNAAKRVFFGEIQCVDDLVSHIVRQASPSTLRSLDFPHMKAQLDVLLPTLAHALKLRRGNAPVRKSFHALFYGSPGTGKTELARLLPSLLRQAGWPKPQLYEVPICEADGSAMDGVARFQAFLLAQQLLSHTPNAVLMFDEIEDALPDHYGDRRRRSGQHKGFMNHVLETSPVPTMWLSNHVTHIDQAFLRRFAMPMEVPLPPAEVRQRMVDRCLKRYQVKLSDETRQRLVADKALMPAMLADTARLVVTLPEQDHDAGFLRLLANKKRLLGEDDLPDARVVEDDKAGAGTSSALGASVANHMLGEGFDPAYVNLAGGWAVDEVLAALQHQRSGRLCLYGPPGTGKTALAAHIAHTLGMPLLVKSASSLLDRYVGGTEELLAKAFAEAREQNAVLFLDEADSFLLSRSSSLHRWEVTQVNELLQQIDQFNGVLICATNQFAQLDAAVHRRFDFKLEFCPLTSAQALTLFCQVCDCQMNDLPAEVMARLTACSTLTPGDFAVVSRRQRLLRAEWTATRWMKELEAELATRGDAGASKMRPGFV